MGGPGNGRGIGGSSGEALPIIGQTEAHREAIIILREIQAWEMTNMNEQAIMALLNNLHDLLQGAIERATGEGPAVEEAAQAIQGPQILGQQDHLPTVPQIQQDGQQDQVQEQLLPRATPPPHLPDTMNPIHHPKD